MNPAPSPSTSWPQPDITAVLAPLYGPVSLALAARTVQPALLGRPINIHPVRLGFHDQSTISYLDAGGTAPRRHRERLAAAATGGERILVVDDNIGYGSTRHAARALVEQLGGRSVTRSVESAWPLYHRFGRHDIADASDSPSLRPNLHHSIQQRLIGQLLLGDADAYLRDDTHRVTGTLHQQMAASVDLAMSIGTWSGDQLPAIPAELGHATALWNRPSIPARTRTPAPDPGAARMPTTPPPVTTPATSAVASAGRWRVNVDVHHGQVTAQPGLPPARLLADLLDDGVPTTVIDLDRSTGATTSTALLETAVRRHPGRLWAGGRLAPRDPADPRLLQAGAAGVLLGSTGLFPHGLLAPDNWPDFTTLAADGQLMLSLDMHEDRIVTHGFTHPTQLPLTDALDALLDATGGRNPILITDARAATHRTPPPWPPSTASPAATHAPPLVRRRPDRLGRPSSPGTISSAAPSEKRVERPQARLA